MFICKETVSKNNRCYYLRFYIARIKRHDRYVRLRKFQEGYPEQEIIYEMCNLNSMHAFNRF